MVFLPRIVTARARDEFHLSFQFLLSGEMSCRCGGLTGGGAVSNPFPSPRSALPPQPRRDALMGRR